jgi:hypothetical protein
MRQTSKRADLPLSLTDRFTFGFITAFFGVICTAVVLLVVSFVAERWMLMRWALGFSAAYAFAVGFLRGSLAADLIGFAGAAAAASVVTPGIGPTLDPATAEEALVPRTIPTDRTTEVLACIWVFGLVLVCWFQR